MSNLNHASAFIKLIGVDAELQQNIKQLGHNVTLDILVQMALDRGYVFDKANLRKAIGFHWGMRWQRYQNINPSRIDEL